MTLKSDSELKNMFMGDFLTCICCGDIIFRHGYGQKTFKYKNIQDAYFRHVKKCFSIKRLLVYNKTKKP